MKMDNKYHRSLMDKIRYCSHCEIRLEMKEDEKPVPYTVRSEYWPTGMRQVVFVGESPGENEVREGRPFCGRSGLLLKDWLNYLDINNITITNVVKCRPRRNRSATKKEAEPCINMFLKPELITINPKVVVAIGSIAARALTGLYGPNHRMKDMVGKLYDNILTGEEDNVYVLYHPSWLLRKGVQPGTIPTWFFPHLVKLKEHFGVVGIRDI